MRKSLLLLLALAWGAICCQAQLPTDGYYRVQNYGSQRYAYLCDKTGSINYGTQNADVGAIQLWRGIERTYDDPASVIYVKSMGGSSYDLQAQGTGLYEIISHYVSIYEAKPNQYQVYASSNGVTKYLSDSNTDAGSDKGVPSFNGNGIYRLWSVFPIDEEDNYLGITPTISVDGKHYASFFASFPFRRVSSALKFYAIVEVDKEYGVAIMEEITSDIIPAAMPMIVECPSETSFGNKIMPVTETSSARGGNLLRGVYFCNNRRVSDYVGTPFDAATMRTLAILPDGTIGFNDAPDNLTEVQIKYVPRLCLPANSAYLSVTDGTPAELRMMNRADYEDYIQAVGIEDHFAEKTPQAIYALDGRQSAALRRGVNIVRMSDGSIKKILKVGN